MITSNDIKVKLDEAKVPYSDFTFNRAGELKVMRHYFIRSQLGNLDDYVDQLKRLFPNAKDVQLVDGERAFIGKKTLKKGPDKSSMYVYMKLS